jgi:hypothetical protein
MFVRTYEYKYLYVCAYASVFMFVCYVGVYVSFTVVTMHAYAYYL